MQKFSTKEETINKVIRFPKSLNDQIEDEKNRNRSSFQLEVINLLEEALALRDEKRHYDLQQGSEGAV